MVLSAESDYITVSDLPMKVTEHNAGVKSVDELNQEIILEDVVDNFEKNLIMNALRHTAGNKGNAAAFLHLDRKSLYRKMIKLGIS